MPAANAAPIDPKKKNAAEVVEKLAAKRILGGVPVSRLYPKEAGLSDLLLLAATETTTEEDMAALIGALKEVA